MIGEGETPLRRGRCGSFLEGSCSAEDRNLSRDWCGRGHRRSEVLSLRGGNEDVVGVNGDVLVKQGKEESVEDFLGDLGRSGRHRGRGVGVDRGNLL